MRRGLAWFAVIGGLLALPPLLRRSPSDLAALDVERVLEFRRLQRLVGERVWPGWGLAPTPIAIVKSGRVSLFDHPHPPAGFQARRDPVCRCTVWTGPASAGLPRFALTALPVEGVATLVAVDKATFDKLAGLDQLVHDAGVLGMLRSGGPRHPDTALYEIVLAHEGFHALQLQRGLTRLTARLQAADRVQAEAGRAALREAEARPQIAALLRGECALLAQAAAADGARRGTAVRQWLAARTLRRSVTARQLRTIDTRALAAWEQQNEWIEGMARYTEQRMAEELAAVRYTPSEAIRSDPEFGGYAILARRPPTHVQQAWETSSRERAYVVGATLCTLLDRLGVAWKEAALDAGEPLERLVAGLP